MQILMRLLESSIERRVCTEALKIGIRNAKLTTPGQTGWPDRLMLIPGGRPLFIEFKRPGGYLTPKQTYIHSVLKHLGYRVEVHTTIEGAMSSIREALRNCLK